MEQANNQAVLFVIGVNHKTAPIQAREKIYIHDYEMFELMDKLKQTLSECLILSTCNRTEIYGVHPSADIDFDYYKDLIINFKYAGDSVKREDFFASISCAACQQLFSVATSVDSKIVGDSQILQQLRRAYTLAKDNSATGKILNQLSQRALKIGKRAYHQTAIHRGAVSVSLAAVELAAQTFGSLSDKTVLIIGAGETAKLTAECLLKKNVSKILITNRTRENAEEFLTDLSKTHNFEGEVIGFENFQNFLNQADIVISSTSSSDYILHQSDFKAQHNKILLLDIAMPRDIEPNVAENDFVVLKNIDDLSSVVDKTYAKRMAEVPRVKKLIYQEMGDFLVWYYSLPLLPMFEKADGKADFETIVEIKKIKQFLSNNASSFHRMARQKDVRSELDEHLNLIKHLFNLQKSQFEEANQ
ncbi:MAG: glutamyl-tRNA reductase [Acidobacteria bacterium]|nr:glutamyl-tRNA reductase [Acidobacteriota bacterium]